MDDYKKVFDGNLENTPGRYSVTRVKSISSLVEVWQEEIDSEGEFQVRRREGINNNGEARAEEAEQRRDNAEGQLRS